jgi:hypothetical protein
MVREGDAGAPRIGRTRPSISDRLVFVAVMERALKGKPSAAASPDRKLLRLVVAEFVEGEGT